MLIHTYCLFYLLQLGIIFCVQKTPTTSCYKTITKLALKTDKHNHTGSYRARTVLFFSCAQTRWEITNYFHYKCRYTNKYIFTDVYLCTYNCERLFFGPYIYYLHLKSKHYFWWMNIIIQTWLLLFVQF